MTYRITGLSPEPFRSLYGATDAHLLARGARRYRADVSPGFPDRIELRDAAPGESIILINYEHQPAETPFRSRHAIFVLEGAETAYDEIDRLPPTMATRTMSIRAFDAEHMMTDAGLAAGAEIEPLIERLLRDPATAYLQAHYATRGCYAARIDRA